VLDFHIMRIVFHCFPRHRDTFALGFRPGIVGLATSLLLSGERDVTWHDNAGFAHPTPPAVAPFPHDAFACGGTLTGHEFVHSQ